MSFGLLFRYRGGQRPDLGIRPDGPDEPPFDAPRVDEAAREGIAAHTLLKRIGDPEDIAKAVHFLIADAGYVTGETINVDGGRHVAI